MSQNISTQDQIIVLLGPVGSGRSTFINCATGEDRQTIGHSLRPCTTDVQTVKFTHSTLGSVVFVDTPGFDDMVKSDVDILSMVADRLMTIYKGNVDIAAIIYLHKISDSPKTARSLMKNLVTFTNLRGQKTLPRVVIATTMWGKVEKAEGDLQEKELRESLGAGCRTERFKKTYNSAWDIIGILAEEAPGPAPLLPQEIDHSPHRLDEIEAGITLNTEQKKLINDRKAARQLAQQAKKHDNGVVVRQFDEQTAEIEEKIPNQLHEMKMPFMRKVRRYLKGKQS
jgi:energy-coupling factor transporter ATP-binding protein EcfA2